MDVKVASADTAAGNVPVSRKTIWEKYILYYWNMSGQIRTAVDRLFALEEGDGNLLRGHGRSCALLMAAEGNGFDDVLLYYSHLMEHLRWKNLGSVLAGGNGDVGDIEGKPEIQKAYELGKSIQ